MPATSKKQKSLACMALAMKKGEMPHTYSKAAHRMMNSMSVEQLEEMCKMPMKE